MVLLLSGVLSCSVIESFFVPLIRRPLICNRVFSIHWSGPALVHNLVFMGRHQRRLCNFMQLCQGLSHSVAQPQRRLCNFVQRSKPRCTTSETFCAILCSCSKVCATRVHDLRDVVQCRVMFPSEVHDFEDVLCNFVQLFQGLCHWCARPQRRLCNFVQFFQTEVHDFRDILCNFV